MYTAVNSHIKVLKLIIVYYLLCDMDNGLHNIRINKVEILSVIFNISRCRNVHSSRLKLGDGLPWEAYK